VLARHERVIAQHVLPFQSTEHSIDMIDGIECFVDLAKGVEMVEIDGYDLGHSVVSLLDGAGGPAHTASAIVVPEVSSVFVPDSLRRI
jgi:hypothetical protein